MSLLYMDGFDMADIGQRWTNFGGNPVDTTEAGRYDGYAASNSYNAAAGDARRTVTASATLIVGFDFKIVGALSSAFCLPILNFWADANATQHLHVGVVGNTGQIQVRRGRWDATILATSTATITAGAWRHFEVKATLSDTVGYVEVKVDGTTVLTYSGDTKNAGTATTFSSVGIGTQALFAVSALPHWDNFYVLDTVDATASQGAPNNDFLGVGTRVRTALPAGAGSATDLIPSAVSGSSVNNWQNAAERPPNAVVYNSSGTTGHRDTYAMGDPSTGTDTIVAAQSVALMYRDSSGAVSMKSAMKSGATVAYGATRALGTTAVSYQDIIAKDPNTSALWTASALDSVELGAEVA